MKDVTSTTTLAIFKDSPELVWLSFLFICIGVVFAILRPRQNKAKAKTTIEKKLLWISIEGIIGAGKSTFIDRIVPILRQHFGEDAIIVVPEPVHTWLESGHLANAAKEPYVAQTFFFHTRIEEMLSRLSSKAGRKAHIVISERSPMSDRWVFWKTSCDNKLPSELAEKTYPLLWNTWIRLLQGFSPSLFLYLKLDVNTSQERMRQRNRDCEQDTVTTAYQAQLEKAHDDLFGGDYVTLPSGQLVPCVQMSSRDDFKSSREVAHTLAERLIDHIEALE